MGEQPEFDKCRRVRVAQVLLGQRNKSAGHRGAVAGHLQTISIRLVLDLARNAVGDGGQKKTQQSDGQKQGRCGGKIAQASDLPAWAEAGQQPLQKLLRQRQNEQQAGRPTSKSPSTGA